MATASEPAKRSTAKKSAAQKSAAQKSPAEKSAAKKAPAKKSSAAPRQPTGAQGSQRPTKQTAATVARAAAEQLRDLTGRVSEGVTAVERTDDGWRVQVQVLELHRIPETTDVLALYDVDMDNDGDLQGYRRVRRYSRGESGEE